MKTKEELTALKEEVETLNKKLAELSEDELAQVAGGKDAPPAPDLTFELPSKYLPKPEPLRPKFPPEP